MPLFGLVDSGADETMFPIDAMAVLGIDKSADCTQKQGGGAGGLHDFYVWNGGKLRADVYGVAVDLIVNFSDCPFILLGRTDFFAVFKVVFDQRGQKFTLEEY